MPLPLPRTRFQGPRWHDRCLGSPPEVAASGRAAQRAAFGMQPRAPCGATARGAPRRRPAAFS